MASIQPAGIEKQSSASHHEVEGDGFDKGTTEERVYLTEEDVSLGASGRDLIRLQTLMVQNRRLCRKTDKRILAILMWIYFLQIFDKVVFGLGNVFGLSADLRLTGAQYR